MKMKIFTVLAVLTLAVSVAHATKIGGRVYEVEFPEGHPIQGAEIVLTNEDGEWYFAETAKNGSYAFDIPEGTYQAEVTHLYFTDYSCEINIEEENKTRNFFLDHPTAGYFGGIVADINSKKGIPALITFYDEEGEIADEIETRTGYYRSKVLPFGKYDAVVYTAGYETYEEEGWFILNEKASSTNFYLSDGSEPEDKPHDADLDGDWKIGLTDLLRVVQLYNSEGYHADENGEDGFAPGDLPEKKNGNPHDADLDGDWKIGLTDLLRVVQLYNSEGYHADENGEDGFAPGI